MNMDYYNVRVSGFFIYVTEEKLLPDYVIKNHYELIKYLRSFDKEAAIGFLRDRMREYFESIISRYYEN